MSEAIRASGLTRRFGDTIALAGVELTVAAGEIFALIGPDGAGKTTLMRILAGILPPDEGEAAVAGQDVIRAPEAVKQRIGYLSQRFSLSGDLSIEENIDFVASLYRTPREEVRRLKEEMLELTDLARFRSRLAGRLSGGMKQKLALTCALIHRPEVLLLDEPTTGVDPVSRRDFYRLLARLPAQGVSVLLTSPYLDEASRAHRLALIDRGRILAVGTADELAGRVEGVLVEIVTRQVRRAAEALAELPDLRSLTPFGDSLHVRLGHLEDPVARVRRRLDQAGLEVEAVAAIQPSLEDAFVALLEGNDG